MRLLPFIAAAFIQTDSAPQHVERLADGVYAIVRHDPIAYGNNANSLVVVGDSGVAVIDAQFTRAATLEVLAAIRAITPKPVRWVVNTHWHDDHVAGDQVYRDTFPDVRFVSHENTRADLIASGRPNRDGTWKAAPGFADRVERLLALGLGFDSTPVVPLERAAMTSTARIVRQYAAESPGFRETLADTTFGQRMTLPLGGRSVELRWFGPANTRGDAVAWVPGARVVATGDLVVAPVPFAFNAFVRGWVSALDSVRVLGAAAIVPGHGPVMHDDGYVRRMRGWLATIRDSTTAMAARGVSLDSVRKVVTLDVERREVAGDDKWMNALWRNFFVVPAVSRAYADAKR